jgi:hypothetical protein
MVRTFVGGRTGLRESNGKCLQREQRVDGRVGVRNQRSPLAVDEQIKRFEYDLTDERFRPGRQNEALRYHAAIRDADRDRTDDVQFFAAIVGIADYRLADKPKAQSLRDVLR